MSTEQEQPDEAAELLIALLEELDTIDENTDEAQSNKHSISDNNGGRIELIGPQGQLLPMPLFLAWLLPFFRKHKSY